MNRKPIHYTSIFGAQAPVFKNDVIVPYEVYGVSWNGSLEVPTKDALYDIINTIIVGGTVWGTITGTLSNQLDLQAALDAKVDENVAIVGATKTKITYDAKGLVTVGADATTADINDSLNRRYVTDAQLVVIGNTSGTNTGDQTSVSGNAGTATALQTPRTINGVSFDGTSNITIQADPTDGDKGDITVSVLGSVFTIDNGVVDAAKTTITGTPDGTKFLLDDFSWQTLPASGLTQPQIMARLSIGF